MPTLKLAMISPCVGYLDEVSSGDSLAARPATLAGKVVGLVPNWRPAAIHLLTTAAWAAAHFALACAATTARLCARCRRGRTAAAFTPAHSRRWTTGATALALFHALCGRDPDTCEEQCRPQQDSASHVMSHNDVLSVVSDVLPSEKQRWRVQCSEVCVANS